MPVRVGAAALPAPGPELAETARLIDRELVLLRGLPIIEPQRRRRRERRRRTRSLELAVAGTRLVAPRRPAASTGRPVSGSTVRRTVPWPTPAEALGPVAAALLASGRVSARSRRDDLAAAVTEVAEHYRLGAASVASIARELVGRAAAGADRPATATSPLAGVAAG